MMTNPKQTAAERISNLKEGDRIFVWFEGEWVEETIDEITERDGSPYFYTVAGLAVWPSLIDLDRLPESRS